MIHEFSTARVGCPPLSTWQWTLHLWTEVSAWLARHCSATAATATVYNRELPPPPAT
jgi:hypothetical protein